MTEYSEKPGGLWSVVLAGGEGVRMRAWTKASYGVPEPKQFCVLHEKRSMFQLTLDRARQITPEGRLVVVTSRDSEQISKTQIGTRCVELLVQPADRGTTGAIYFALSHIMWHDPNARVVIFPSDHFVEPEATFIKSIQGAIDLSALIPDKLVLIGVSPDRMESNYGYILPGATIASYGGNQLSSVKGFREKPLAKEICRIHAAGGLWSTFIIIGTAQAFFDAAATCIPKILRVFYSHRPTVDRYQEKASRECLFQSIAPSDFSKNVLQMVPYHLAAFQLNNVHWSDWGRPDRVARSRLKLNANNEPMRQGL